MGGGQADALKARRELLELMEELSEEYWCAGWYSRLEYVLWQMVQEDSNGGSLSRLSRSPAYQREMARLRELSRLAGGWWRWNEDGSSTEDVVFTPLEEWLRIYEADRERDPR